MLAAAMQSGSSKCLAKGQRLQTTMGQDLNCGPCGHCITCSTFSATTSTLILKNKTNNIHGGNKKKGDTTNFAVVNKANHVHKLTCWRKVDCELITAINSCFAEIYKARLTLYNYLPNAAAHATSRLKWLDP